MKEIKQYPLTLAIIVSMFIWGVSWPSGKILSHYGNTTNIVFIRFIIVCISLFVILKILDVNFKIQKTGIKWMISAGILMTLYGIFFLFGVKHGAAGAGGVLTTTLNPIIAYGIGLLLTQKIPNRNETLGLLLGIIAGLILLKVWENFGEIFSHGNIYFLLCAITWAIMSKITAKSSQYGNTLAFSFWMYFITIVCLGLITPTQETIRIVRSSDSIFWVNILYNGIISTSIATTIYFLATTKIGPEKASSFIFLVPLSAAVSSYVLLDEKIQVHTIVGGCIGILAVFLINKKPKVGI